MTEPVWRLVAVLGGVAFAVGLYLGFAPLKVAALDGTLNCGSAFRPNENFLAGALVRAECDSKREDRRTWAVVTLIVGGVTGLYAVSQVPIRARRGEPELSDPARNVSP